MRSSALRLTARFRWKLVPALLVVGLGDWLFYQHHFYGGYLGLFAFAVLGALIAGRPAVRHDRRAWVALAAAGLFALALIYDASLLSWSLFWGAVVMATLIPATARFDDGWRWLQRLVLHGLRAPFAPLIDLRHLLKVRAAGRSGRFSLQAALAMFALPVIGSLVIIALFAAANPLVERFVNAFVVTDLSPLLVVRMAFWGILFMPMWSLLRPRLSRWLLPSFEGRGEMVLPGVSVASVTLSLILFNLLFAAQNLMDAVWLWGWAPMPQGMTMADYAHRGAYPLIATALLAALFVLVTLRSGSDTARTPVIRRLVMLWIGQNIILVASSMLRTADYIEAYSLTRLRIAALLWMALVAFGLAAICWRLLRGRSAAWLINVNLAAAGLVLGAVCFIDLGEIAARWNVRHAREVGGRGVALDLCYMSDLGESALLPLLELAQRRDLKPEFNDRVQFMWRRLHGVLEERQQNGWTFVGQRRLNRVAEMLVINSPPAASPGWKDCAPPRPKRVDKVDSAHSASEPIVGPVPSEPNPALTGGTGK
ncbi:DUF4153 domain-containing protein [Sphingobium sp. YR768]|uniref:DUF4153 domain-containing protein n=1 Tax=Sphingobium sp. YR768 TaxID=1884365 RepID=UPI0008C23CC2|nr:DUF4173 domain-containing protein [Sphingobium sp. YR768]SES14110.1 protein of unknown function [Sphingobium sp. YR768]